ncbi:MAG: hypothetical protein WCT25_00550 [Candidatus Paceibacterota bacterium]
MNLLDQLSLDIANLDGAGIFWLMSPVFCGLCVLFGGIILLRQVRKKATLYSVFSHGRSRRVMFFATVLSLSILSMVLVLLGTLPPVLLSEFRFETVKPMTMLENREGHVLRIFRHGEFVRRSDLKLWTGQGYHLTDYHEQTVEVAMVVRPVTENPKVQQISYQIVYSEGGSPRAKVQATAFKRKMGAERHLGSIADCVRFHLYNFQFQNSKELAKFSNPMDYEQQIAFEKMVRAYLEPKLAEGWVRIRSVQFQLE